MAIGESIYNEVIMSHNQNQKNKKPLVRIDRSEHGHNPSCGDDITLDLTFEGDRIIDMSYKGIGCAISQASTSMMIDLIKGKTKQEAFELTEKFIAMIKSELTDEAAEEIFGEIALLSNIKNMPARVKCAVLAWRTLAQAVNVHE